MPQIEFVQGSIICSAGDQLHHLLFITKGSAEASFHGHKFQFEQGDTIGLCDIKSGSHSQTYTATSDLAVFSYPYDNIGTLEKLLRGNADVANLLIKSMCHQIFDMLQYRLELKNEADSIYEFVTETYPQYENLCNLYALTPRKLSGFEVIEKISDTDLIEDWVHNYYSEMKSIDQAILKGFFSRPGITSGFFHQSTEHIFEAINSCNAYLKHIRDSSKLLINSDSHDIFSLISELHFDSMNIRGADANVEAVMSRLLILLSKMACLDPTLLQSRVDDYKDNLKLSRTKQELTDAVPTGFKQNLADSLELILDYSECPEELANEFERQVNEFSGLADRNSSDDIPYRLRKKLTDSFYIIYKAVFIRSLIDPAPPTVIKMFLNFGYVDAKLAGFKNADYLYSIADSIRGDPEARVYTISEWLTSIFEGKKEPSRNDFDEDYTDYLRSERVSGRISAEEEARLLEDLEGKLLFELENVFPIANKITFGRITTFCPVFGSHNVQRELETSMVTPAVVKEVLDGITAVDYSAYTREVQYMNPECGVPKEYIHEEVLPDFILMPNVGMRGAMWQEMEGRKRNTPSRMFLSIFMLSDLKPLLVRLTAEFRWEMCKRIHSVRWSDLSDPSLTSEFFNYLQFYKSNRDLSSEVKASIKTELVRAKNIYKAVFVANYVDWMLYEANGSPRLNKFVRKILLLYCPFVASIRERLAQNPQYADILRQYELKRSQREVHLTRVLQKIQQTGSEPPQEILDEIEYVKR